MKNLNKISKYFIPHRILDIGCHMGEFYTVCKSIYPDSYYFLIDGNINCIPYIQELGVDFSIELLSDSIKEIDFYVNNKDLLSTGCSYYRECNTEHFIQENLLIEKRMTNTLDDMFEADSVFDLIKMDTQGSELDIIKGGKSLLKNTNGLLLECSLDICNENAPLYENIKEYLNTIGFIEKEILDCHYYKEKLTQIDALFIKK